MNKIEFELKYKCGIYLIVNLINGKRYVGSSINIYNRIHEHIHNLKNNKSHNQHLQNAWNKYGEDKFMYSVLEYCDPDIRFDIEQYYIDCLKPEYNFSLNVIGNLNRVIKEETRIKISNTLKRKYSSGEIKTYRQEHNWKKAYIYNINTYKLEAVCDCLVDANKFLRGGGHSAKIERLYYNKYIVSCIEFNSLNELVNYINKNYMINKNQKYIIREIDGNLKYYRSISKCEKDNNINRRISKRIKNSTIDNPYIVRQSNIKIYCSDKYIPVSTEAVPIEKSSELLSGNIGGSPEMDNPEINSEIAKGSESSYSVGGE